MTKKLSWQNQLNQVLVDNNRGGIFGTNIEWDGKSVRRFLTKLEKLGAKDIKVKDIDTISFVIPDNSNRSELLLHVLTNGPFPAEVEYNKLTARLTLSWDY